MVAQAPRQWRWRTEEDQSDWPHAQAVSLSHHTSRNDNWIETPLTHHGMESVAYLVVQSNLIHTRTMANHVLDDDLETEKEPIPYEAN